MVSITNQLNWVLLGVEPNLPEPQSSTLPVKLMSQIVRIGFEPMFSTATLVMRIRHPGYCTIILPICQSAYNKKSPEFFRGFFNLVLYMTKFI